MINASKSPVMAFYNAYLQTPDIKDHTENTYANFQPTFQLVENFFKLMLLFSF